MESFSASLTQKEQLDQKLTGFILIKIRTGLIDENEFRFKINQLTKQHEMLKSKLKVDKNFNYPVLQIDEHASFEFEVKKYYHSLKISEFWTPENTKKNGDNQSIPFHLVLHQTPNDSIIEGRFNKLYFDSYSIVYLLKCLLEKTYQKSLNTPPDITYTHYANWIETLQSDETIKAQILEDGNFKISTPYRSNLNIPIKHPTVTRTHLPVEKLNIQKSSIKSQYSNSKEQIETLFFIAFSYVFSLYSENGNLVVGKKVNGRKYDQLRATLGPIDRFIPVSICFNSNLTVELTKEIHSRLEEVYEAQEYLFDTSPDEHNTFEILFEYVDFRANNVRENHDILWTDTPNEIIWKLIVIETADTWECSLYCPLDLYHKQFLELILTRFKAILMNLIMGKDIKKGPPFPIKSMEQKLINQFSKGLLSSYQNSFSAAFSASVTSNFDKNAIVFEDKILKYSEVFDWTAKLGAVIVKQLGNSNNTVGVMVSSYLDTVLIFISGLRFGFGVIPIDIRNPKSRVDFMLKDSKATLFIHDDSKDLTNSEIKHLSLNEISGLAKEEVEIEEIASGNSNSIAYILYTSGSTGNPKGVRVSHHNLMNYLTWANSYYFDNKTGHPFAVISPLSFDFSLTGIFTSLLRGDTVHLFDPYKPDISLNHALSDAKIKVIKITPSHISLIHNLRLNFSSINKIIVGGEMLTVDHIDKLKSCSDNKIEIYNEYGPTECTVGCTISKIDDKSSSITIGRPIDNVRILVLDKEKKIVPIGIFGEIYIGGAGVAKGYIDEHMTSEKFMKIKGYNGIYYKSGDCARWLMNGELEFVGRLDNQLKINGFRVEPKEIELAFTKYFGVVAASFIVQMSDTEGNYLALAYESEEAFKIKEIKAHLLRQIPDYMIPRRFLNVKSLPLTVNGKVDEALLIEMLLEPTKSKSPARNPFDQKVLTIISRVLHLSDLGIDDNFFEIGGHSISAVKIISKLRETFIVEISLQEFFNHLILKDLIDLVHRKKQNDRVHSKIKRLSRKDYYPISKSQSRLWILHQFEENAINYNVHGAYLLKGNVDIERLQWTCKEVVSRHEILRTTFNQVDDRIVQKVSEEPILDFNFVELNPLSKDKFDRVRQLLKQNIADKFDFETKPPCRIVLTKVDDEQFVLTWILHHIVCDAWSLEVLYRDFIFIYDSYPHAPKNLPKLDFHFKDFANWHNQFLNQPHVQKLEEKLIGKFRNATRLELPTVRPRPKNLTNRGKSVVTVFDSLQVEKMKKCAVKYNISLYMLMMTFINILLTRYSQQKNIIIGTTVSGRERLDLENQVGFYVNTIPLKFEFENVNMFKEFVDIVREECLESYELQTYPFDELVNQLDLPRELNRNPLFDILVSYNNTQLSSNQSSINSELEFLPFKIDSAISQFDLTFRFNEVDDKLSFILEYSLDLFDNRWATQFREHFVKLINTVSSHKNDNLNIKELELLSPNEYRDIVFGFNNTERPYPNKDSLISIIEENIEKNSKKIALYSNSKVFTFGEINDMANQVAHHLIHELKVQKEDIIGLILPKSQWMIAGIMGILKSGAAYMPIDPEYPLKRIENIVDSSKCKVLLTDKITLRKIEKKFDNYCLVLVMEDLGTNVLQPKNPKIKLDPNNLCYVIYTSGSTGLPKGVMIEHRAVINRIDWMWKQYNFSCADVVLQKTPFVFDVSVWEIFIPLCYGIPMVLCPREFSYDVEYIADLIRAHNVSTIHFVPSMLNNFISGINFKLKKQLYSLKRIISSGEVLQLDTARKLHQKLDLELHNLYGPTEATVDVTYHRVKKETKNIPIGSPINNVSIFILDDQMNPVPIGVVGEIFIAGVGVARGYLNNPTLTNEKFVKNPFTIGGSKMYRTGDLGSWDENGEVNFKGRKDFQIKIRGHRIELGEIESQMLNFPEVKNAVAVASQVGIQDQIVAYVNGIKETKLKDLKLFLTESLPNYMVPAFIVIVDAFKFTPTGKINRKELPEFQKEKEEGSLEKIQPKNQTEKILLKIWNDVLGVNKITSDSNFFDVGGNSINALQIVSRINNNFKTGLKLKVLFQYPTILELAIYVDKQPKEFDTKIPKIKAQKYYNLSFAQRRMWLAQQIEINTPAYVVNSVFRIKSHISRKHLEESLKSLIERHELFRINIHVVDDEPKYRVLSLKESNFSLKYKELDHSEISDSLIEEIAYEEGFKTFNLAKEIPIRALLVRIKKEDFLLAINYHHIVSDGWSNDLIVNEVIIKYLALLEGKNIDSPKIINKYADYVAWHTKYLTTSTAQLDKQYWLQKMNNVPPQIELPFCRPRPTIQTSNGKTYVTTASTATSEKMRTLAKQTKVTIFHLMLALTKLLIHKYTGQTDIVIGSDSVDRPHKDLELNIGLYLDIILLRNKFSEGMTFIDLLNEVSTTALEALEHQRYPIDKIFEDLNLKREINKTPFFNYFILYQNFSGRLIEKEMDIKVTEFSNKIEGIPVNLPTGKFDLSFVYEEDKTNAMSLSINFNTNLFRLEDIIEMTRRFGVLIEQVLENPDLPISDYTLFADTEISNLVKFDPHQNSDQTLVELFIKQLETKGSKVAISKGGNSITYEELHEYSNHLSSKLVKLNIIENEPIPVILEESIEYVICVMAILKVGVTLVPISPTWPKERIDKILAEINPKVIICKVSGSPVYENDNVTTIVDFFDKHKSFSVRQINQNYVPYIIYTSGTTGKPKGVEGSYTGLLNRLCWMNNYFGKESAASVLQSTKNIFDSSLWQILWPLINGGKVVIPESEREMDVVYLKNQIKKHKITMLDFVPSLFNELMSENLIGNSWFHSLRDVIFGGEAITVSTTLEFKKHFPHIRITNLYGPTEASIGCIFYMITGNENEVIPIGRPIDNVKIYILDNTQPVPPNVPGEIYITGNCLSFGYFKNPEMTNKNFVYIDIGGKKIRAYKTGDIGIYNVQGNIEFLGRLDRQLKLNGLRIEPEEIEYQILKLEGISQVVIHVKHIGERESLVAYYTSKIQISQKQIKEHLARKLPASIIPNYFIKLKKIPLTQAGKTDYSKLPLPKLPFIKKKRKDQYDKITMTLITLWEDKMSLKGIGPDDNFFELGGNSLEALKILGGLHSSLGLEIKLRHIFEYPTINSMVSFIKQLSTGNSSKEVMKKVEA